MHNDLPRDSATFIGEYIEAQTIAPLRRHFQCAWIYRAPDGAAAPILVVPDGCVDLRWADGMLTIVGPDRIAKTETVAPGSTVVGLRFQPAAAIHWLGLPMSELVDCRIGLEEIWGGEARRLIDTIGKDVTPAVVIQSLQAILMRKAAATDPPSKDMAAFFALLNRATEHQSNSLANAIEQLGTSERTVRRRCNDAFGYGPKTLQRILRFQRFLAHAGNGDGLADSAAVAGYADQAHLSREVSQLTGVSPAKLIYMIV